MLRCFKISCQIDEKIRVSQKLTLICAGNKRFPRSGYQEGWETEFTHTGGVPTHGGSSHTQGIKKGGKRISHPRGEFTHTGYQEGWEREFTHTRYQEGWETDFPPTGGVHTHGGSSHTRGVKKGGKRISHPRGEFTHTGGVLTHGVSRRVGNGFPTHGGISHPRREFSHTGGVLTHGVSRRVGKRISHPRRDFPPTEGVLTHGGSSLPRPP